MKLQNLFKSFANVLLITASVSFLGACSANDNPSGDVMPSPVPYAEASVKFTLKDSNHSSEIAVVRAWVVIDNTTYPVPLDEPSGQIQVALPETYNSHVGLSAVTAEGHVWLANLSDVTFESGTDYDLTVEMTEDEGVQLWAGGPAFATVNVGAASPTDYGLFFAWGATADNASMGIPYSWDTTPYYIGDGTTHSWSKYTAPGAILDPTDDAARVNWGGEWRMPTEDELSVLADNASVTATWTDDYQGTGVAGIVFAGATEGYTDKHIFLVAGGVNMSNEIKGDRQGGGYWSSQIADADHGRCLNFRAQGPALYFHLRYFGCSVRPVKGEVAPVIKPGAPDEARLIDLGLPSGTKWANMDIGAEGEGKPGQFFAFGELKGYDYATCSGRNFFWETYKWNDGSSSGAGIHKYQVADHMEGCWYDANGNFIGDGKGVLDPEDDAAIVLWGDPWRMPTAAEVQELIDGCTSEETTIAGQAGRLFTSKTNGETIFFPYSGDLAKDEVKARNERGYYWSTTVSEADTSQGMVLFIGPNYVGCYPGKRFGGRPIRPVQ
jgi:hypothetical protein